MDNQNVLVQMKRDGKWLLVKTYSRNAGRKGRFFIDAEKLSAWIDDEDNPEFWDRDCGNIMRITFNRQKYVFMIELWWLSSSYCGNLTGVSQRLEIDAYDFAQSLVRDEWQKFLCKADTREPAHLIWTVSAQRVLHGIAQNKRMRRAFSKAMGRGYLQYPGSIIRLFGDFPDGSFFFKEDGGICGGLICHSGTTRNGYKKLEYCVHT